MQAGNQTTEGGKVMNKSMFFGIMAIEAIQSFAIQRKDVWGTPRQQWKRHYSVVRKLCR
jgi:hypothetical protein